jgi:hypothetical protein
MYSVEIDLGAITRIFVSASIGVELQADRFIPNRIGVSGIHGWTTCSLLGAVPN